VARGFVIGPMNADGAPGAYWVKHPVYVGATVTALISVIPRLDAFAIVGMVLGPLAATWLAAKTRKAVDFNEGANIGFSSVFYGLLAATSIHDIVWHIYGYRLWRIQNLDRLLDWFAEMLHNTISPFSWIVITVQIITTAICAGIFGAPAGILGVRIFRRRN
jgi:hypothetical protein